MRNVGSRVQSLQAGRRNERGALIVEFAGSCFMFVLFAFVASDIGVLLYAAFANDRACRDACRAAAMGETSDQAKKLASTVLQAHAKKFSLASSPLMNNKFTYQDYNGKPAAGQSPFVQLSTSTSAIMPFAPVFFFKQMFGAEGIKFTQTYTYPIMQLKKSL